MSKYTYLIDNGHGSNTPGKRSPVWEDGRQLFEYEFNRAIAKRLIGGLTAYGIDFVELVPEDLDVSLPERVKRANAKHSEVKNCVLISIHANAGGGTGFEVFTTIGETKSDKIATVFYKEFEIMFPEIRMRADNVDGDPDKESNFYIIKKTSCPAILVESFFMDRLDPDCEYLMSEAARDRIAVAYLNAILNIESNGIS